MRPDPGNVMGLTQRLTRDGRQPREVHKVCYKRVFFVASIKCLPE